MKSLALDERGDLLIQNNVFQMVDGKELIRQKVQEIINTNKGEWFFDWEQGIDFSNILGKGVTEEEVRAEIEDGLKQVDDAFIVTDFSMKIAGRALTVKFTAENETDKTVIIVSTEY